MKLSKIAVKFEHPATGNERCSTCKHFEVHGKNMCEIVEGKILPTDWCNRYERSFRMAKAAAR